MTDEPLRAWVHQPSRLVPFNFLLPLRSLLMMIMLPRDLAHVLEMTDSDSAQHCGRQIKELERVVDGRQEPRRERPNRKR